MDRFLIRLENQDGMYLSSNTMGLLIALRQTTDPLGTIVKNLRVSSSAIEFDLYASNEKAKLETLDVLEKKFGKKLSERNLNFDESALDKLATVEASIRLFDDQRFWECHETMEQLWRREPNGPEKDVQQGLILAASALVHFQKGEDDVCLNMIPRALAKLDSWKESGYLSLDVAKLKQNLRKISETKEIKPFSL